ncbi:hypothetical protein LVD17_00070 [Fulvivirga ulvae]|uniref:SMI1/KNR4 family protein n=1 Tax=Fulvivirga ulvae TaxID=2904245 RepID=UPI001F215E57|nr:SMI1/KNR4 family protein [Fulvivirga ulvae]UII32198.1 hypothetical protein LVD17_28335 [Fulvivirga ulvae]UII32231.1 hypothetical protein LVD17_00070 [Fulvivirga ulvae]
MTRITEIKNKLEELKDLDKRYSVFGSNKHKYQLGKPLSAKEIERIEKQNGITLSDEYKIVLTELGNGGAGNGYGLECLSLNNISPPYKGTEHLLRNCDDPNQIDLDMIDIEEVSGYIKLFDYGCGMEQSIVVTGEETGTLIFYDCDGRFERIKDKGILDLYEHWLNTNIELLKRVKDKLENLTLEEVIASEWTLKNFSIKHMILSIMDAPLLTNSYSGNDLKLHLEREYSKWINNKSKKENSDRKWWQL